MKISVAAKLTLLLMITGTAHAQLVGNWVADDWSGTGTWKDRVNGRPATISSGLPTLSTTPFGLPGVQYGITFGGSDAFTVTAADNPASGAPSFTVLAMFRTSTPGYNNSVGTNWWNSTGIVGGEQVGNHNDWGLKILADKRAQGGFKGNSYASGDIADGMIHTTALTWDGATGQTDFYLDGVWQGMFTQSSGTITSHGFAIASFQPYGTYAYFTGDIAVVQLYSSIEDVGDLHRLLMDGTYGSGCQGSNGIPQLSFAGASSIGKTLDIKLSSAPPMTGAFLNVGFTNSAPYPFDLSILGATGCKAYNDPFATTTIATNGAGGGQLSLAIPVDPGIVGLKVFFQWLVLDPPANTIGLTTSDGGVAVVSR